MGVAGQNNLSDTTDSKSHLLAIILLTVGLCCAQHVKLPEGMNVRDGIEAYQALGTVLAVGSGMSFDSLLAVYTGDRLDRKVPVAANDNYGSRLSSCVSFEALVGTN